MHRKSSDAWRPLDPSEQRTVSGGLGPVLAAPDFSDVIIWCPGSGPLADAATLQSFDVVELAAPTLVHRYSTVPRF